MMSNTIYRTAAEVEPEKPESFPLEKILTVSARDYCESIGKSLMDYTMSGVHRGGPGSFAITVPKNTEVLVDYRIIVAGIGIKNESYIHISGTALIPKLKGTGSTGPR